MTAPPPTGPDLSALAGRFPPAFVWGTATAAYQIEGAVSEDGRGPSIWDTFSHEPSRTAKGETGDVACDHYHRMPADIGLMRELGVTAYRFSVGWPRIQPAGRGTPNAAGLDFYDRLVDELLAARIRPFATLYHWDLPQALEDAGGWPARDIVERFADYAAIVGSRLGDRVKDWIPVNEPWVVAFLGYRDGIHAPGRTDAADAFRAAHHTHLAHRAATAVLRSVVPGVRVGTALSLQHLVQASDAADDVAAMERLDAVTNRWFLDPTFGRPYPVDVPGVAELVPDDIDLAEVVDGSAPDFLGLNYYTTHVVAADPNARPLAAAIRPTDAPRTTMGWEVVPSGLRDLLVRLQRTYDPPAIFITENGAAFPDVVANDGVIRDAERAQYLGDHIAAVADAREAGARVDGYFVWSLLDNFEWAFGYGQRFGIVRVDFATQARTVKASGRWYAALIAASRAARPSG